MADFSVPTHEELIDDVATHFETEISGSTPRLRATDEYAIAHAQAGLVKGLYGHQQHLGRQIFASTAEEINFWRIAAQDGVFRKPATKSIQRYQFTGTDGGVIEIGKELERADGLLFVVTTEGLISGSVAEVTIEGAEEGASYNNEVGQQLTLTEPIDDVQDVGTVVSITTTGTDQETKDGGGLERYLQHIRSQPAGGGPGDYIRWALLLPGATRAWEFPLLEGPNSVSVAFTRDAESPITPDLTERNAMATFLKTGAPISDEGYVPITVTLYVIELSTQTINIVFSALTPNTLEVRNAISEAVADLLYREGGPGKTIPRSRLDAAISSAVGEQSHVLTTPAGDIVSTTTQVPVIGTVTVTP